MNRLLRASCALLLIPALAGAAELAKYRGFELGGAMAVSLKQAGVSVKARVIQERPALIEELDWRPAFRYATSPQERDPVQEILLRFFDKKLFQIVATYDRQRIQGMTQADMVEAISATYGAAMLSDKKIPFRSNYGEVAEPLAQWGDPDYVYSLVRTGDQSSFALVATLIRLDKMAQESIIEAKRLDVVEAPQRAAAMKAKLALEEQAMLEQSRQANKPRFKP